MNLPRGGKKPVRAQICRWVKQGASFLDQGKKTIRLLAAKKGGSKKSESKRLNGWWGEKAAPESHGAIWRRPRREGEIACAGYVKTAQDSSIKGRCVCFGKKRKNFGRCTNDRGIS